MATVAQNASGAGLCCGLQLGEVRDLGGLGLDLGEALLKGGRDWGFLVPFFWLDRLGNLDRRGSCRRGGCRLGSISTKRWGHGGRRLALTMPFPTLYLAGQGPGEFRKFRRGIVRCHGRRWLEKLRPA